MCKLLLSAFTHWIIETLVTTVKINGKSLLTRDDADKIWKQAKQNNLTTQAIQWSLYLEKNQGELSIQEVLIYLFSQSRLPRWIREEVESYLKESGKVLDPSELLEIDYLVRRQFLPNSEQINQWEKILEIEAPELFDFFPREGKGSFPTTISPPMPYNLSDRPLADDTVSPQLKQFLTTLQFLAREYKLTFDDLHAGNVMQRPGTGEIVIADIGYLKFT